MNNLELVVSDVNLDITSDQSISLNYQISDIFDVTSVNTNYSFDIELPMSPKNNRFFKDIAQNDIDNKQFVATLAKSAILKVNSKQVIKGNLQLISIPKQGEFDGVYKVQIVGRIDNLISNIENYTLRDLDMSEFNHIRNRSNIISSWNYDVVINDSIVAVGEPGIGYFYPHIVTGEWDNIQEGHYISDIYPALYSKTITDKIFELSGFTITSKFLESAYYKNFIIPYSEQKIQKTAEVLLEETTRIGIGGSSGTILGITPYRYINTPFAGNSQGWWKNWLIEDGYYGFDGYTDDSNNVVDEGDELQFQDPLNSWGISVIDGQHGGRYKCQKTGYYNIKFTQKCFAQYLHLDGNDLEYDSADFVGRYYFRLRKNGLIIFSTLDGGEATNFIPSSGAHASPWVDTDTPLFGDMSVDNILLEVGDFIKIEVGFEYLQSGVDWKSTALNKKVIARLVNLRDFDGGFTKFIVEPADNKDMGNTEINMNAILPNIKCKEYLLSIVNMFNLVILDNPDKENDLIIEPYDDFFGSKQRVLDWTYKRDDDQVVDIKPMSEIDANKYLFTYKADSDFYNKEYTDETKKIFGDYFVDVPNDFSNKTDKTELIFSPTPGASKDIFGRVAPYFVDVEDGDLKPKKVNLRILFHKKIAVPPGTWFRIMDFPGGPETIEHSYPYCGMWNEVTNPTESLEFGLTTQFFDITQQPVNNLFQRFHKAKLSNLIDYNSRIMEAEFNLSVNDIESFDFRDIILIDNSYWRVNSINNYNPGGSDTTTKVVLYKLNELDIFDKQIVEVPTSNSNCPDDIVRVLRNDGSGTIPSGGGGGQTNTQARALAFLGAEDTWTDWGYYISPSGGTITEDCCKQLGGEWVNGSCRIGKWNFALQSESNSGQLPTTNLGPGNDVAIANPAGVQKNSKNGSNITYGTLSRGNNQYITEPGIRLALGNNIMANSGGVTGSIAIGDNIDILEPHTIYTETFKINKDGVVSNEIVIIDGGLNQRSYPFDKIDLIDIVDGSLNQVRQWEGDSKARPIIDGNTENQDTPL